MTAIAQLALVAAVAVGFRLMRRPSHRVVFGVYVLGLLFLPEFGTDAIEGAPPAPSVAGIKLTKPNALALGLLAGSLVYDHRRWLAARVRWFDLPVLAWCVGPVVSSVANSLLYDDPVSRAVPLAGGPVQGLLTWLDASDLYDGLVRAVDVVLGWGVPYWLGRLYVTDRAKLTELVLCMVAGAAVYAPLCLVEMALSPQLHRWVYGFHQHEFLQSIRMGGFRPMVFMSHGLAVGLWMVVGALAALWLYVSGPLRVVPDPLRRGRAVNGLWAVAGLGLTAALCKSTGALALGATGLGVLALARAARSSLPALALLCVPPLYVAARAGGTWDARESVGALAAVVGPDRADSFDFRLRNEDDLAARALERPLVGWGGWGRWHLYDPYGKKLTVADGLWVIAIGERGLLGLVTLGLVLLVPPAVALDRTRSEAWADPSWAAVGLAAVALALFAIDCLMNAMVNPVYLLLAGGLLTASAAAPLPSGEEPRATRWRVRPTRGSGRYRRLAPAGRPGRALNGTERGNALPHA